MTSKPPRYEDPDLTPRLAQLEEGGVDHLSLDMRCRLFQHIVRSVETRVRTHTLYVADDKTQSIKILHQNFLREENALIMLLKSFRYTEQYKAYFTHKAQSAGAELAAVLPLQALPSHWAQADLDHKLSDLKGFAKSQFNLFAQDGLNFPPPRIELVEMVDPYAGRYEPGRSPLSFQQGDKRICISRSHVQNSIPFHVFKTQWHEGVHSLCQNFAAALHQGQITKAHPLYQDAQLECARKKYGALTSALYFPRAYRMDPEEKLAYGTEEAFFNAWQTHSCPQDKTPAPGFPYIRESYASKMIDRLKKLFL